MTLAGAVSVRASGFAGPRQLVITPTRDSLLLAMSLDSVSILDSRGKFVRTLVRWQRKNVSSIRFNVGVSGEGRPLAIIENRGWPADSSNHAMNIVLTDGMAMRTLSFDLDFDIQNPMFAGNEALVFYGTSNSSGARDLHFGDVFSLPLSGGVPRNLTTAEKATDIDDVVVSPDGRLVATVESFRERLERD